LDVDDCEVVRYLLVRAINKNNGWATGRLHL